jgi:hypothetical protein
VTVDGDVELDDAEEVLHGDFVAEKTGWPSRTTVAVAAMRSMKRPLPPASRARPERKFFGSRTAARKPTVPMLRPTIEAPFCP